MSEEKAQKTAIRILLSFEKYGSKLHKICETKEYFAKKNIKREEISSFWEFFCIKNGHFGATIINTNAKNLDSYQFTIFENHYTF